MNKKQKNRFSIISAIALIGLIIITELVFIYLSNNAYDSCTKADYTEAWSNGTMIDCVQAYPKLLGFIPIEVVIIFRLLLFIIVPVIIITNIIVWLKKDKK